MCRNLPSDNDLGNVYHEREKIFNQNQEYVIITLDDHACYVTKYKQLLITKTIWDLVKRVFGELFLVINTRCCLRTKTSKIKSQAPSKSTSKNFSVTIIFKAKRVQTTQIVNRLINNKESKWIHDFILYFFCHLFFSLSSKKKKKKRNKNKAKWIYHNILQITETNNRIKNWRFFLPFPCLAFDGPYKQPVDLFFHFW